MKQYFAALVIVVVCGGATERFFFFFSLLRATVWCRSACVLSCVFLFFLSSITLSCQTGWQCTPKRVALLYTFPLGVQLSCKRPKEEEEEEECVFILNSIRNGSCLGRLGAPLWRGERTRKFTDIFLRLTDANSSCFLCSFLLCVSICQSVTQTNIVWEKRRRRRRRRGPYTILFFQEFKDKQQVFFLYIFLRAYEQCGTRVVTCRGKCNTAPPRIFSLSPALFPLSRNLL